MNSTLALGPVNVLIGANGSGKSNFIGLFKMLNRMMDGELQVYVAQAGGADQILHYGRKQTDHIELELWFRASQALANGYSLSVAAGGRPSFGQARNDTLFHNRALYNRPYQDLRHTNLLEESQLAALGAPIGGIAHHVYSAMRSWQLYHFHDTSETARLKQMGDLLENRHLLPDAANLAAYLYLLRERFPQHYRSITETIRLAAPFFGDFILRPHPFNPEKIRLEWRERGSDLTFGPNAFSDGTLRFICLTTLFLQPAENLPATIILDEPEIGLHPYAIVLLAEMIHSVSEQTHRSSWQRSRFRWSISSSPHEILVVDRAEGTLHDSPSARGRNCPLAG